MKVVLVVSNDAVERRSIADALLRAGYGVCETHTAELLPAVPRLDAVVSGFPGESLAGAPLVHIARPLSVDALVASVGLAVSTPRERAA